MPEWLTGSVAFSRKVWKACSQPHRRAAFIVLMKAGALVASLSEAGWLLNTRFFSKRFEQLPISLAWSMLTVIFVVTAAQFGFSIALKLWDKRALKRSAIIRSRFTALLASHLAGEDSYAAIHRAAGEAPDHFECCVAMVLLRLRGSALRRLCELPEVIDLRDEWIARARKGDEGQRRRIVEQLSLLRDPATIPALERALVDSDAGVVAAAIRGLLRVGSYRKGDALVQSLGTRPLLVRVLTACEIAAHTGSGDPQEELEAPEHAARAQCSALAALGASGRKLLRRMSEAGEMGDAPAEALGASLVSAFRGGAI